jgi:hypothetical protein
VAKAPSVIINNPTEHQLAQARALHRLQTDPKLRRKVNTEIAERVANKRKEAKRVLLPKDIATMRMLPWSRVSQVLTGLNNTITYKPLPDGKVAIGLTRPSRIEVGEWEKMILSPAERKEVQRLGGHQGPRPYLVAASMGWISPYTDLLTDGFPQEIICRSLKAIIRVLVGHGAFTWSQAEAAFGFRLLGPGTETKKEKVPVTPKHWAEKKQRVHV